MTYYAPKFGGERRVGNEADLSVAVWTEAKVVEVRKPAVLCDPISAEVCVSAGEGVVRERAGWMYTRLFICSPISLAFLLALLQSLFPPITHTL